MKMTDPNCDLLLWLVIQCVYCEFEGPIRKFHHSYQMKCTRSDGTIEEPVYYLTCPHCNKQMILKSIELEKKK